MGNSRSKHIDGDYLFETIKNYSTEHGISLAEFCRKVGWKPQYMQSMKGSNVYMKNIIRAANAMDIPVDTLLDKANVFDKDLQIPKKIMEWVHTKEGKEWVLKGYADFRKKRIEEQLKTEQRIRESKLATDLEKAVRAMYTQTIDIDE